MSLVRPIPEYGAVCSDPHREGQVSALKQLQGRATKFANEILNNKRTSNAERNMFHTILVYAYHIISSYHALKIKCQKLPHTVRCNHFCKHLAHVGLIIINVFTVKPSFKASSRST
jgi:hypothetical protein